LTLDDPEAVAFGSTQDALALWGARERAIAKGFCEAVISSSSSLQQVQLACARSISFLDQKSRSSSTTTWEKREVNQEELTATCLCAPIIPLYPSTTFAAHFFPAVYFFPRVHWIETEAALRDHCNLKIYCVVPLCLTTAFFSQ
jgi:hypothetical protein